MTSEFSQRTELVVDVVGQYEAIMGSYRADLVVWRKFYALDRFILATVASFCDWFELWVEDYELTVQIPQHQVLCITANRYRVTSR
jgi:hypothetical protein